MIQDLIQLSSILTLYQALQPETRVWLRHAFQHQTPSSWNLLRDKGQNDPVLITLLDQLRLHGYQVPK